MNLTSVVSRLITVESSASRIESFLSWKMEFRYIRIFDESKESAFFFYKSYTEIYSIIINFVIWLVFFSPLLIPLFESNRNTI